MLKITPYLGATVLIVSIAGVFYPLLGYFLPLVFATLTITCLFRGRWFCGNLCPRGSLNDFWISKISLKRKIPKIFKTPLVRAPIFVALMAFMTYRIIQTNGVIEAMGMVFVTMCIVTTAAAILLGVAFSPRAWCTLCPMGSLQAVVGGGKKTLSFDSIKCIDCNLCNIACPMQLKANRCENDPDCIRCGRCVSSCPAGALRF